MRTCGLPAIVIAAIFAVATGGGARLAAARELSTGQTPAELTLKLWLLKAEQGDPAAQYLVGFKYVRGEGVRQNLAEAAKWLRASADQGNPNGQWSLGTLYELGFGVTQDYAEAFRLYRLAAEQGVAAAQANLGAYYLEGLGTERNYSEAYRWLRTASREGLAEAEMGLGAINETGLGRPADLLRAYMWFSLATDTRVRTAAMRRDEAASRLTPAEIGRADEMARRCAASDFEDCD